MERSIKKLVQLVKIDNGCFLLSRQAFRDSLDIAFPLSEFTMDPLKNIYITDKLQTFSYIGCGRKQIIPYIQRINFVYIHKNGQANFEDHQFPPKLYVDFISLEKKNDLKDFFAKSLDFCVFPSDAEMIQLFEEYKKAGLKGAPIYYAAYGYKIPKKLDEQFREAIYKIVRVNVDFIWKKQQELKKFVEDYLSEDQREHKILWLKKQIENAPLVFTNQNSFLWKKVRDGSLFEEDTPDIDEVVGMKNIKSTFQVESYRIYGHFAYCCLELFLDMQKDFPFYTCKDCGQLNYKPPGSKMKTCPPEKNEKCRKLRQRNRKMISEKYKKIRNSEKLSKILKKP